MGPSRSAGCRAAGPLSGCGGSGSGGTALVPGQDNACAVTSDNGLVTVGSGLPGDPAAPEPASGYRVGKTAVHAKQYMVTTANPYASRAGCEVLKKGGSAVDAAVAVQMVLGLVEPQSSGLGGGAFMLHYDAVQKKVQAYDGRETAPAAATANYLRWVSDTDRTAPQPGGARASGRSIGTPGAVRMLELAHRDHGRLAWGDLFQPAEQLARDGFPIGGRMAAAISGSASGLARDAEAVAYFFNADGTPKALGTVLKNTAYADTLSAIARNGADAFYTGPIAQGIVAKIQATSGGSPAVAITPGLTQLSDLADYRAKRRDPVCTTYRDYWVCGMSPPLLRRHRRGLRARHPGELRSFATQAHGHRHRGRQAHGDGSASRERGGAPGLRRPRQVRGRYRLRPLPGGSPRACSTSRTCARAPA